MNYAAVSDAEALAHADGLLDGEYAVEVWREDGQLVERLGGEVTASDEELVAD